MIPTLGRELGRIRSAELVASAASHARSRQNRRVRGSRGRLRTALGGGLMRVGSRLLEGLGREGA